MNKKKIGFFLGGFQGSGGIGRVVSILARELRKKGYEVATISYCDQKQSLIYEIDEERNHYLFSQSVKMTKAITSGKGISQLRNIINQENIDVVVACGVLFYPLAYLATRFSNKELIFWEHSKFSITSDYKFQGMTRKFLINKADAVVCLTKRDMPNYKKLVDSRKLFQIYNPVDYSINRDEKNLIIEKRRILSVGRLAYPKNYEETIEIAKVILNRNQDWSWDIYGEGPEKEKIEDLIYKYDLENRVNLMGRHNDMYSVYPQYDILAMTSRYEGFPMALLEGMASGLPLIAYNVDTGPDEIIEEEINGYLIQPFDRNDYINKIQKLINNKVKRTNFSKGNKIIYPRFSLDTIVNQWADLLS